MKTYSQAPRLVLLGLFAIACSRDEAAKPAPASGNATLAVSASAAPALTASQRDLLVQPYLPSVEDHGERALVWIDGEFTHAVRKTPLEFIKRFIALLNIELPRQTLENMVVAQARNLFTVDASAEEQPDLGEIDNLAKSLLDAQLSEWESQKLISQQNGQLATKIDFKNGTLLVNSTRVALPWEEAAEEDAPPAASAAQ